MCAIFRAEARKYEINWRNEKNKDMKRVFSIILWLSVIGLVGAAPVSKEQAKMVGENFFTKSIKVNRDLGRKANFIVSEQSNAGRIRKSNGENYAPYYILNNEDGGFVIVSGDDCATPILGYSTEGSIDVTNLPIQLEGFLQAYTEEIQYAADNNLQATDYTKDLWNAYRKAPQNVNTTAVVNALISTTWSQAPYYNIKCPSDASLSSLGGHPSTGCVATAMGQIMKYWEYPRRGIGNKSYNSNKYGTLSANFASTYYNWSSMPLKLSSSTSTTQNESVATLMYHCGVAVEMNYNSDGKGSSSANTLDWGGGRASAETALKTYFGYSSTVKGKQRSSMSASSWIYMLKTELDNQRPMLYRGASSQGGHAFICDGYDSSDKFHFNWGWSGQANGYFTLTALNPDQYNFSSDQCAVIGIQPQNGSGPAKSYKLYMNTDLEAINTNSSSTADPNVYNYGNAMSFTAKVENNGTSVFKGILKVGVFTASGEFIAWSKETPSVTIAAGGVTDKKTYTFDGGKPFFPGKYIAYMYYKDADETDSQLVETDDGLFLTEYNYVAFSVKMENDLKPISAFNILLGDYITGSKIRIEVNVRNTALLTTFYGLIKLCLYDKNGLKVQDIDYVDFYSGFSASTTKTLSFTGSIDVTPGSYYLALIYQKKDQTAWYYLGSIADYPNPVRVNVKAPTLYADEYESNNSQTTAAKLNWSLDEELHDFSTDIVSLHDESDIDFYKLEFPNAKGYTIQASLYDKYNPLGSYYVNADAQFAYSVGGNTYSSYFEGNKTFIFNGPTTLYFKVVQHGLNGLGFYELDGEILEGDIVEAVEAIVAPKNTAAKILRDGQILIRRGEKIYTITGIEVK